MTSRRRPQQPLDGVRGSYSWLSVAPAEPAGNRAGGTSGDSDGAMLFLQGPGHARGSKTVEADLPRSLKDRATLHISKRQTMSFHVLKKSGRTDEEVLCRMGNDDELGASNHAQVAVIVFIARTSRKTFNAKGRG